VQTGIQIAGAFCRTGALICIRVTPRKNGDPFGSPCLYGAPGEIDSGLRPSPLRGGFAVCRRALRSSDRTPDPLNDKQRTNRFVSAMKNLVRSQKYKSMISISYRKDSQNYPPETRPLRSKT